MMTTLMQSTLPFSMFDHLQGVRTRYAMALAAAGRGDYSHSVELRTASRYVGRLLAHEARKTLEERNGVRMLEISLAVDRFFPELRAWHQYDVVQRQVERLNRFLTAS